MELLKQLYELHSPSGSERKMKKFVKAYVRQVCPDAVIAHDNAGNVYVTKGESDTYPCIAAHLDQVQRSHSKDFTVVELGDVLFGYSPSRMTQEGLGADDKNGIWIALKCLERFPAIKLAFFVGEEVGCVGSSKADMSFFKDCRFIIEPDRKGGHDFIQTMSFTKVCSDAFRDATGYQDFGYKLADGLLTDVLTLVENGVGISCINLSCGYYHPHTDEEAVRWSELVNCLNLVCHIIQTCTDVYPHTYVDTWAGWGAWKNNSLGKSYYGNNGWVWNPQKKSYSYHAQNDAEEERTYRSEPIIPHHGDYDTPEELIIDLLYFNEDYSAEELYPYVSADLDDWGVTFEDYCRIVDENFCDSPGTVMDEIDEDERYAQVY